MTDRPMRWAVNSLQVRFSHNAIQLRAIAWRIVNPGMLPRKQDLVLALAVAERANVLAGGRDEGILEILALVQSQRDKASEGTRSQGTELPGGRHGQ